MLAKLVLKTFSDNAEGLRRHFVGLDVVSDLFSIPETKNTLH
jgi:hypothetical protein